MVLASAIRLSALGIFSLVARTIAFDPTRYDNLAVYWGQNSYGATHSDVVNYQKTLSFYCQDDTIDVIPVAFVSTFFGTGGLPVLNLANICNNKDNATFPGSSLPDCSALASDVETCQAKGKVLTISLGGAGASVGFSSDAQGSSFADQIWNLFLGGTSSTRPLGSVVLDGVDIDVESGSNVGYAAFVNQLRTHFAGASKKYYITGAPQCPYPDATLGAALNAASFDAVYVQFYDNQCGLNNFPIVSDWDFGAWDIWARNVSLNPDVKIYIGAPASSTAAGSGYQSAASLSSIATQMRNSFPSFGGVMLWDASQAYPNGQYDVAIKASLVAAGGTGFTFPACSAPVYVAGNNYPGGSQVSLAGYIWQANYYASSDPTNDPQGDWSAISACSGTGTAVPPSTSSGAGSTTSSNTATPTSGTCAGVAAWSSSVAYAGGSQVTSDGHLWTAQWWTQGDTPGESAGVWTDDGVCATAKVLPTKVATVTATASGAVKSASSDTMSKGATNATTSSPSTAGKNASETGQSVARHSSRVFRL